MSRASRLSKPLLAYSSWIAVTLALLYSCGAVLGYDLSNMLSSLWFGWVILAIVVAIISGFAAIAIFLSASVWYIRGEWGDGAVGGCISLVSAALSYFLFLYAIPLQPGIANIQGIFEDGLEQSGAQLFPDLTAPQVSDVLIAAWETAYILQDPTDHQASMFADFQSGNTYPIDTFVAMAQPGPDGQQRARLTLNGLDAGTCADLVVALPQSESYVRNVLPAMLDTMPAPRLRLIVNGRPASGPRACYPGWKLWGSDRVELSITTNQRQK